MAEQSSVPVLESLSHLEPPFPASTSTKALIALTIIVVIAASSAHFKNVHEREPPVLRSWVPFIGHLVGMIRQRSNYLPSLAKYGLPIASLPILNGKVYAIWDGSLIQAVYRNKNLSFVPFVIEFAQRELGYGAEHDKIVKESGLMDEFFDEIHKGMAPHYVHRMNVNALQDVAITLKSIGDNTQEIPNAWLWIRDLMTLATCKGLYGPENPIGPDLLDLVWDFERDLAQLMFFPLPQYSASKSYNARAKLQAVLNDYYARKGDHHEGAAGITRHRADVLRKFGVQSAEVGIFEVALLHVATSNTIPTLFWFMMHIVSRPELVDRLREEVSHVAVSNGSNIRTVNVTTLANECPLLVSCYREAIRICNRAEGQRKVMKETTISDGKGRSYLLKEGTNIQMSAETVHNLQQVWGEDATEFNPNRFLEQVKGLNNENVKAQRTSYIPFGGGRHLCPGRNFAMAENLGFMVAFILGFEVSSMDGKPFVLPIMEQRSMTSAVCKPLGEGEGFGTGEAEGGMGAGGLAVYFGGELVINLKRSI